MKKLILLAAVLFVFVTFSYSQFTFTSIDCPGAERTRAHGINNNGDIVGSCKYPGDNMHAVLIRKGEFIPLAPTTLLGTSFSVAYKINGHGDVVGIFIGDDGFYHGFLLRDGVLTILDFPGANETYATGLNDSGTVTGWWNLYDSYGNINIQHGFIWKDGTFTDVTFPGADVAAATGINARGDFVGGWSLSIDAPTGSGFVSSKGNFTSFDAPFPGLVSTQGDDINDFGDIVGLYIDDSGIQHSFLKAGATITNIDYPGAAGLTSVWGINSVGEMVGNWRDSSGAVHGWLAEPGNRCAAAPSDLIGWWPGNGNAQDIVSGANGATMGAGFAKAIVKKGFTFDGVDDYVDVPDPLSLPEISTAVTVAAWVNPQMSPDGEGWVFAFRDPLISEGISLYMNNDGFLVTVLAADTVIGSATGNPVIKYDGNWKHIALTADTTTGRVTLFLNGVVVQDAYPGLTGQFVRVPHLFFGQRQRNDTDEGPGMAMHYKGLIDEVQLFNRALAPSEILTMYQAGGRGVCKEMQQTFKTLYEFTGADGAYPAADLLLDKAGNLYGTTVIGGTSGSGTVFKLDSNGNETVLYNFTFVPDGALPTAGLMRDDAGNFYGTTSQGGSSCCWGIVFKLDVAGKETVLYRFTGGADGWYPNARLIRDDAGNLYGTTTYGGYGSNLASYGTVFKLDSNGNYTVLYTFTGGADGANPSAGLVQDDAGNFYGTTTYGGASGWGTVFKLDSNGNYTVLHSFSGGADGCWPTAGLIRDKAGSLYGTTSWCGTSRGGTVFKVDSTGNETVLYSFIDDLGYQANPFADLVQDNAGNLYGTTVWGGAYHRGTVFRVDRNGNMKVLHEFTGGADGGNPYAGLAQDKAGNLYGTTTSGGSSSGGYWGGGTVFKLLSE
jgi:uncharacterized repeat protein (TIGR03803 family)